VESITLANPCIHNPGKKKLSELEIHASVPDEIDCVQRALLLKKPEWTYNCRPKHKPNLKLLDKIKTETSLRLKLLSTKLLYKCPFRKFHFNATTPISPGKATVAIYR
jgi:hypothetical protein